MLTKAFQHLYYIFKNYEDRLSHNQLLYKTTEVFYSFAPKRSMAIKTITIVIIRSNNKIADVVRHPVIPGESCQVLK